jgi:hypothetical protein
MLNIVCNVGLKPLYYLGMSAAMEAQIALLPALSEISVDDFGQDVVMRDAAAAVRSLADNPELVRRMRRYTRQLPLCALVASVTQTAQLLKAAAGVAVPAAYFRHDPLLGAFRTLSAVGRAVGVSAELAGCLGRGAEHVHRKLAHLSNRRYYLALFRREFVELADCLASLACPAAAGTALASAVTATIGGTHRDGLAVEGPTPAQAQLVLSMLDPVGTRSGLLGCAPALGRILEQALALLRLPPAAAAEPAAAVAHFVALAKSEALSRMVMYAELGTLAAPGGGTADWPEVVLRCAHDPAHRGNALTIVLGPRISLPHATVERAAHVQPIALAPPSSHGNHHYLPFVGATHYQMLARLLASQLSPHRVIGCNPWFQPPAPHHKARAAL